MCGRYWTIDDAEWAEAVEALRQLQEKYPGRDVPRGLIVPTLPAAVFTREGPLPITGLPVSLLLH